jgi:hypothetical protein
MDLFKLFYGFVINDINIKQIVYGTDFREYNLKLKHYHDFRENQSAFFVGLKRWFLVGEATSNLLPHRYVCGTIWSTSD